MRYRSTKLFDHTLGWSTGFRQWRAVQSHCQFLHGYALAVHLEFEALGLDFRNWVVDFGGLKSLRAELADRFDHKVLVAEDDPLLPWFREGERLGALQMVVVPATGCEAFAAQVAELVIAWLEFQQLQPRVRLVSVEVREHGANSAKVVF